MDQQDRTVPPESIDADTHKLAEEARLLRAEESKLQIEEMRLRIDERKYDLQIRKQRLEEGNRFNFINIKTIVALLFAGAATAISVGVVFKFLLK